MSYKTIILTGAQGSGKGTQASLLEEHLRNQHPDDAVFYYESGAHFRGLFEGETYTNRLVKESVNRGEIQPDFLATNLLANFLKEKMSGTEHLIIEGFPRTLDQAKVFTEMLGFYKREGVLVIDLELDMEEAVKRLLERGRKDDTEEGIRKRLGWYEEKVAPVVDYFKQNDFYTVVSVDGNQSIEDVQSAIINTLSE